MDSQVGSKDTLQNLKDVIDLSHAEVLNSDPSTSIKQVLSGTGVLKSDSSVDQQLLIKLPMREPIKLKAVKFHTTNASNDPSVEVENDAGFTESGPLHVKIFVNQNNLSFQDMDSAQPIETLTFTQNDLKNDTEKLVKFVKYQNVQSLCFFIEDNQNNSDVTAINRITLIGSTIMTTKMGELKKIGDD